MTQAGKGGRDEALGPRGEGMARIFLQEKGLEIIEENYRTRWGEIDLIARDGPTLVFVEVKTRSQRLFGSPLQAVTPDKQRRLRRMATMYLAKKNLDEIPARFDVVGITLLDEDPPEIVWIPNAFGD
jgi:putative endonuclease